ncbi:hypothetical protein [Caulobacter sp. 17J65-9]|uniref:hypothetical protein n=1 Tax=Caulobacter sp. 17J65-9 TaxID=2709382 RepID=UPI0013CBD898|nr:hypothetical protein [Caulobacter sp. 17J65-9]NEX94908.1 hypothetical protein [Caulobacter sp. 17J65-9]
MAKSRLVRWLHLIGYATTLIVVVELVAAGIYGYRVWQSEQQMRMRAFEMTRTHARPLTSEDLLEADAVRSLASVRQTAGGAKDALHYVAMPSFSDWYAMTLYLPEDGDTANVALVVVHRDAETGAVKALEPHNFTVPKAEYLRATVQLDELTHDWAGEVDDCFDGTPVAFERVKGGAITSAVGNAECSAHYRAVNQVVERLITPHAPKDLNIFPEWWSEPATPSVPAQK